MKVTKKAGQSSARCLPALPNSAFFGPNVRHYADKSTDTEMSAEAYEAKRTPNYCLYFVKFALRRYGFRSNPPTYCRTRCRLSDKAQMPAPARPSNLEQ
jgi:hypothetical protein